MSASDLDIDDGPAYAAAVGPLVDALGGGWLISAQAGAFAKSHGLRARVAHMRGRASVLGDVDADVVTAAFGFWPSDLVRESWEAGMAAVPVEQAGREYAEVCRDWGRERYAALDDDEAARLAELLGWIVDSSDVAGLPLFAGWRARPLPDDARGRLNQLLHVHREQRGGVHLVAVLASGLTPLQAVLAGSGGSAGASFFGWEEPFESVADKTVARAEAEALTDRLLAPAYDVLGRDERIELLALLQRASDVASATASD